MCIVSDKIKFCTCSSKSIDRLQTYWELFRFNSHKELYIVGIPKWPSEWSDDNFEANTSTLLKRLNDSDAFDFPTDFQEKDAFKIVIQSKDKNIEPYKYSFDNRRRG